MKGFGRVDSGMFTIMPPVIDLMLHNDLISRPAFWAGWIFLLCISININNYLQLLQNINLYNGNKVDSKFKYFLKVNVFCYLFKTISNFFFYPILIKQLFKCPKHNIYISPTTFEYQSELDNLLWKDEADLDLLDRTKGVKRESRIARDRSEDAVTWNVFRL